MNRAARSHRVRPSVVRRTLVGSLVVMLSPFLLVLESDVDASVRHRTPIVYNSAPILLQADPAIRLLPGPLGATDQFIASIQEELRAASQDTWSR
ncbi:MAG: hypothetical protein O2821_07540 [Chloroflexi bacterium]|nr:hypothetical protein [Chloroflexota bacterium]MDA1228259.1 hypothetical protein [Chloroflexota bacterium]